jgi:hypothetical protein
MDSDCTGLGLRNMWESNDSRYLEVESDLLMKGILDLPLAGVHWLLAVLGPSRDGEIRSHGQREGSVIGVMSFLLDKGVNSH